MFEIKLSCYFMGTVTSDISVNPFEKCDVYIPKTLVLIDPGFNDSAPVDFLLGTEVFWTILRQERI